MKTTDLLEISREYENSLNININTLSNNITNFEKSNKNDDSKEPVWKCRYTVILIALLSTFMSNIHRSIMSVVIVAMVNNTAVSQNTKIKSESCPDLIANFTEDVTLQDIKPEGDIIWSPETQGYILSCLFFGHLITMLPSGSLAERFGSKPVLLAVLFPLGILTMLIPFFARFSVSSMIVIQTLRGLLLGIPGPCVSILVVNWSPKTERGFYYSVIVSCTYLGPAIGNIFSGYISESPAGWPYAFYTIGGAALLFALYITFFLAENPNQHPHISKAELNFILAHQECKFLKKRPTLPLRQILTSVPVYALMIATFGYLWILSQFWTVQSIFLGTILHYPIVKNGLFSAVPFFVAFLISNAASWISGYIEKAKIVSVNVLRKFWILTSSLLYSLCLLGMYIAGCNSTVSAILSILSLSSAGLGIPGALVVKQDISPTFAGTIHSITTTVGYLSSVILPLIVGYLTDEMQTLEQWNKIFFISIGVVMSTAIIFTIFGSAEVQPWNFANVEYNKEELGQSKCDNEEKNYSGLK